MCVYVHMCVCQCVCVCAHLSVLNNLIFVGLDYLVVWSFSPLSYSLLVFLKHCVQPACQLNAASGTLILCLPSVIMHLLGQRYFSYTASNLPRILCLTKSVVPENTAHTIISLN